MTTHRIFTATLPNGTHVLVQVWTDAAEVAFRDNPGDTWGVPTTLTEVSA